MGFELDGQTEFTNECNFAAAELFARDDDVERMNHGHWPHDREDRQAQAAKAEQPEDQVQPKGTGLNSHLGGNGQGGRKNARRMRNRSASMTVRLLSLL